MTRDANDPTLSKIENHDIRLASPPKGIPNAANFILAETELEPRQDQQVLVRNLFMSVDSWLIFALWG